MINTFKKNNNETPNIIIILIVIMLPILLLNTCGLNEIFTEKEKKYIEEYFEEEYFGNELYLTNAHEKIIGDLIEIENKIQLHKTVYVEKLFFLKEKLELTFYELTTLTNHIKSLPIQDRFVCSYNLNKKNKNCILSIIYNENYWNTHEQIEIEIIQVNEQIEKKEQKK